MNNETQFANIVAQVTTDDLFTYVVDNKYKFLAKIEYSGEVIFLIRFPSLALFDSTCLHLSPQETLYLYDNGNRILYEVNPQDLSIISTKEFGPGGKKMLLDNYGNIIRGNWIDAVVDNENRIYTIEESTNPNDYSTIGFDAIGSSFLDVSITTMTQIIEQGFLNILCRYEGPEEKTTDDFVLLSTMGREVVTFTNVFYEEVQFQTLYPNSGINGVISKPFHPQSLLFTRDDFLYVYNDTREVIKLEINKVKPIRFVEHRALFNFERFTGKNLYDLTDPGLDNRYDDFIDTPLWPSVSATATSITNAGVTWEFNFTSKQHENYFWIIDKKTRAMYKTRNDFVIVECFSLPEAIDKIAYTGESANQYNFDLKPTTSYEWHRKFSWLSNDRQEYGLNAFVYTKNGDNIEKHRLVYKAPQLTDDNWYHVSLAYDRDIGRIEFYVDNVLTDYKEITPNLPIYNLYKNGMMISNTLLRSNSINEELNCNVYGFDGIVYDVRMYDLYLTQSQQAQIILSNLHIEDVEWNIPIGARQYIEQIERFFKHRTPGNHSQYFSIRLSGLEIDDISIRKEIERIIKQTITKVAPTYVSVIGVEWDD